MHTQTPQKRELFERTHRHKLGRVLCGVLALLTLATLISIHLPQAHAATNSTLNFQARLQSASGGIAPDGLYNIDFKLYNHVTNGAQAQGTCSSNCLWEETYYDSNGVTAGNDNRVTVRNGYLTVNLGSQTAFPGTINWDQDLWIVMNVGGTTQTATPTWDGEMSPRLKLTATNYAFKAGQLATFNSGNGFTGTLQILQPTVGNQVFQIADQGAAGTYSILTNKSGVLLQATTPGTQQVGNLNIDGTGIFGTALQSQSLDRATSGTLTLGTGTNSTAVTISKSGAVTTVAGTLTVSEAATFNGNVTVAATKTLTITSGATSLTGATTGDAVTISNNTSTGNIAIFKDNATTVATIADGGAFTLQNAANSAAAFNVNDLSGTSTLRVNTTDRFVGINNATPAATLDVAASSPAYLNGFETGALSPLTTAGGGTPVWHISSANPASGTYHARVDNMGTGVAYALVLTQTLNSAGTISFDRACNGIWDGEWTFQIDAGAPANITGCGGFSSHPYATQSAGVGSGTHTFTWSYTGGFTAGGRYLDVDNIKITNVGPGTAAIFNGGGVGIGLGTGVGPSYSLDVKGDARFKSATDSTTSFSVQNAAGTPALNIDTISGTTSLRAGNDSYSLGSDLASNVNFATNWTTTGWTLDAFNEKASHNTGNTSPLIYTGFAPTIGTKYEVKVLFDDVLCGTYNDSLTVTFGGVTLGVFNKAKCNFAYQRFIVTATSTAPLTFTPTTNSPFEVWASGNDVTIKQVTGSTIASALTVQNASGVANIEVRASSSTTNSFIGLNSGKNNVSGTNNTALGANTLQSVDTGGDNTAVGYNALTNNTFGWDNTALGYNSLQGNTSGWSNVGLGSRSLNNNTTGNNNTAVGYLAGYYNATGDINTFLGYKAGYKDYSQTSFTQPSNLINATAIGAYALAQSSNSIVLGSVDLGTKVGIGITIPSNLLSVSAVDLNSTAITATQSTTTVTASGSIFSAANVGEILVWADGTTNIITAYTDATHVTVANSATRASGSTFRTHKIGLQVASTGNIGIGTVSPSALLDVAGTFNVTGAATLAGGMAVTNGGNVAFQRNTTDITATGTLDDINIGTGVLFRFAGASAQTLNSIANPSDGRIVTIINDAATALTVMNETGTTPAYRIITGTGTSITVASGSTIQLTYDSSDSRWRVVGGSGGGGGGVSTVGTIDTGTYSNNGASISGSTVYLQTAGPSATGLVNFGAQTFGGNKQFNGVTTAAGGLTVTTAGNLEFQRNTTDITTTGALENLAIGTGSVFRFNGASAQTLSSIASPTDGRKLTIINAGTIALIIKDDACVTSCTATNRIRTGTSSDISVGSNASIELIYDSGATRWRVIGSAAINTGAAGALQAGYNASTGGTTPEIKVDTTRGAVDIQDADTSIAGSIFTVRMSNSGGLGISLLDVSTLQKITLGTSGDFDTPVKLPNPASLPVSTVRGAAWSPDGTYLVTATPDTVGSNHIAIYKRSGDTFTKLANPATMPTGYGWGVAWSPDGTYMSVAHSTSPFITVYKRSGDTFTKLADPATLPTGQGTGVSWSPDGVYMSVSHQTNPRLTIYKRSGDTFTKLTNPANLPPADATGVAFSPEGSYMTVTNDSVSPYITIYKRSGDTFTKLADPAILPVFATGVAFSPDGIYMSVSTNNSPYISIYKRSGDTFTKLANPASLPVSSNATSTAWSPDGQYVCLTQLSTPFITIYKRDADVFTKMSSPATLPAGAGYACPWSPDGQYMAVGHGGSSPYLAIYKASGQKIAQDVQGSVNVTNNLTSNNLTVNYNISANNVQTNGIQVNGSAFLRNQVDTTDAFIIQNASSQGLFAVGTSNQNITLGASGDFDTPTKLPNPSTLPASNSLSTAWSPDGQYMTVTHNATPYITIYKRSGDTFTKLPNPATLPAGTANGVAFSDDGTYMSVAHATSPYITIYKRSGDTFTKLTDPATLPAGTANGVAFSADGTYMSVAHATSPYITIYKRSGDTFTKLPNPATLPAGTANGVAFSADGVYMTVASFTTPYITIYKRSGDTFTKLTDPATLPAGIAYSTAWSPDGIYMSVAHVASPYVTIYKRSGDTFTKLTNPATLPSSDGVGIAWSPDGQYMTVANGATPFITIYKASGQKIVQDVQGSVTISNNLSSNNLTVTNSFSANNIQTNGIQVNGSAFLRNSVDTGEAFTIQNASSQGLFVVGTSTQTVALGSSGDFSAPTKLADPATLPTGQSNGVAYSPNNTYLSVAHATSPFVTIYKRSGDTYTKLPNPSTLPTGQGLDVAWSPDGTYMTVAHGTTPFITIYKRSGDTFTKLADPATLPGAQAVSVSWSPDGLFMTVAYQTSPFMNIYRRSGDTFTKLADPATIPTGMITGVAWSPDSNYMSITQSLSPYIFIYKRSGTSFTKLADPSSLPLWQAESVAWSPDGIYMTVTNNTTSPYLVIYKRSGDTFTKLSDPATVPTGSANSVAWSPDGRYMSVSHFTSPFITIYERTDDTFTKLTNPASLPTSSSYATTWSSDGQYMALGLLSSPYLAIYKAGGQKVANTVEGNVNVSNNLSANNLVVANSLTANSVATNSLQVNGDVRLQDTTGTALFSVDTVNDRVVIGTGAIGNSTGYLLVLDSKNNNTDPTGVNGAMYYNATNSRFRCYEFSAWRNCTAYTTNAISTSTLALTAGTDTYLNASIMNVPSYGLVAPNGIGTGTLYTWKIYLSKTAAGTVASTITLRVGQNATTADTARCTAFSTGVGTAVADGAVLIVTAQATAGGAAATMNCSFTLTHQLPITGFATTPVVQAYSTAASFDSTPSITRIGLSFNAGTANVITVQKVEATMSNF